MSDPRSNIEIMDVLSSIRRLVSEDRKTAPTTGPSTEPAGKESGADSEAGALIPDSARFVLTPAFRVVEADAPQEATASTAALDDADSDLPDQKSDLEVAWVRDAEAEEFAASTAATRVVDTSLAGVSVRQSNARIAAEGAAASLEETIAELEAAVGEIETDFEPDGGDADDDVPVPSRPDVTAASPVIIRPAAGFQGIMAGFDAMTLDEDRLDTPITAEASGDAPPPPSPAFWRTAPAKLQPAPGREDSQAAPETAAVETTTEPVAEQTRPEPFEGTLNRRAKDWAGEDAETIGEDEAATDIQPDRGADDRDAEETPVTADAATPLAAKAVDAETADAEAADAEAVAAVTVAAETGRAETGRAEPVGAGRGRLHLGDFATGRPLIFRPDVTEVADAPLAIDTADDDADHDDDADQDDDGGDDDLFDPLNASQLDIEMLRDMVSEIIRAELRGTLGERITRNLRQLVRREIERALEAERAAKD